jgi:hypothetical protein
MEAISYVNIFETKGLEYLLVISFLIGFLLLVRYVASQGGAGGELGEGELSASDEAWSIGSDLPVTCVADFECPYRTCLADLLDGEDDLDEQHSVA